VLNKISPSKKLLYVYWRITLQEHGQVTNWTELTNSVLVDFIIII